jgi:hypothetical protein
LDLGKLQVILHFPAGPTRSLLLSQFIQESIESHEKVFEVLITGGTDPDAKNGEGESAEQLKSKALKMITSLLRLIIELPDANESSSSQMEENAPPGSQDMRERER